MIAKCSKIVHSFFTKVGDELSPDPERSLRSLRLVPTELVRAAILQGSQICGDGPGGGVILTEYCNQYRQRASVRAMIEARGARLAFLPPYSPDFNPIEMAFAKLKALLRKAAERTVDGLWNAIGRLVDVFPPQECANYFAAAGYDAD